MRCDWCNEKKPMTHECMICHARFCCIEHAVEHFKSLDSNPVEVEK